MKQVLSITRKELDSYFGSPMALIFVGIFLLTVHFSFFWVSGFFGRGIADVRPLFQWMPILLIFLISTLTMRQWSEEQQTGTLEMLLTMPIRITQMVIGKFIAVLILVIVALILTLSLPITVAALGPLDIGPVIGGYLAAILMAAAYIAIGLFISSRTDNQIVSLLLTAIVCGAFYLVGSQTITGLASTGISELLRDLGTGSRFESIERGVIDLRDLLYYVSLTVIFLTLNVYSLDTKRWSIGKKLKNYRFNRRLGTVLLVINIIVFNVLLSHVTVRADVTQNQEYTLSPVTTDILSNLQEPLLVRGYFSQDTHPLLSPLIPQLEDLLQEYKIAAGNKMELDFVDPIKDPALEQEANQTYNIKPTPLQVNDRGKTSVINAYFDILIRYGDQNTTLNLLNMINTKQNGDSVDVTLRNPEYDITSSIKKVVYGFQSVDAILASLKQPAQLTLYYTPDTLPDDLKTAPNTINDVATGIAKTSNGKFSFKAVNVTDPNSGVTAQSLYQKYQIQPIESGFLSSDSYFLDMVLDADGKTQLVYPTGDFTTDTVKTAITTALNRTSSGFLHVIGLWTSASQNVDPNSGQSFQAYDSVQQALAQNYSVRTLDLTSGQVDSDVDALVIIGPENMTDVQRYAVDQYLMRGGSVFVAAGNFQMAVDQQSGQLALQAANDGLQDMLASYGITVDKSLVMDTQNAPFPAQVARTVNGATINETQAINYPPFVDVRANGMDVTNPAIAQIPEITLNWVSPITVDATKTKGMTVSTLIKSTANAWTTTNTNMQPDLTTYPNIGFAPGTSNSVQTLAVAVTGSFSSFFTGKPSVFAATPAASAAGSAPGAPPTPAASATPSAGQKAGFIAKSPDTARLIVVGSSEFLNDTLFNLAQNLGNDTATNNVQFVQNSADWFTEDAQLSAIRAKAESTRVLIPLQDAQQTGWEVGNYIFALLALIALGVIWQVRRRSERPMILANPSPDARPMKSAQGGA